MSDGPIIELQEPTPKTPVKPPAPGRETDEVIERAANGDKSCLPQVQALLSDAGWVEYAGSPAEWLRQAVIGKMSGKHVLIAEAAKQKLARVQSDFAGSNPTPIERLLAERASLCWFLLNWYEERFTNASDMSITQADYFQRRIDRAHKRFLSAVETLARVRKLALPSLMVNIAKNQQVNVGETRE